MTTELETIVMGPPKRGPWIKIVAEGISMVIQMNDELDKNIVKTTLRVIEKKRYGYCAKAL